MTHKTSFDLPLWSIFVPPFAVAVLGWAWMRPLDTLLLSLVATALIACVIVAVHHAEVVAHKVGEPFGTLILALSVTVIEVALIVTLMMSPNAAAHSLARDTVFAAVMIVCNGVIGISLLAGAMRPHVLQFRVDGSAPALSVLAALVTLTLVMPSFTSTTSEPTFSAIQLVFAGAMSLRLYGVFIFVQTVRHRDYFLPIAVGDNVDGDDHAPQPLPLVTTITLAGGRATVLQGAVCRVPVFESGALICLESSFAPCAKSHE